jgi:hypothetical protein
VKDAMQLRCSAPAAWPWHDALTIFGALIGALIGAGAVLIGQIIAARNQEKTQERRIIADKELKQMEFDRLDAGVKRQLVALVGQVSTHVEVLRRNGYADYPALRQVIDQMDERIYKWEVPTALQDYESEALYRASESIELAYQASVRMGFLDVLGVDDQAKRFEMMDRAKELWKTPCQCLCTFWATMGDISRQVEFQELVKDEKNRMRLP